MEGHSVTPPRLESVGRIEPRTELSIPPIQTLLDLAEVPSAPGLAKLQGRDPVITVDGLPLKTYILDNMPYTMQHPTDESYNSATRRTVDGRTLEYKLHVIQQPERARACGAGARSSADRRPVDPPPVVELRVLEIGKEITDITYSYNAGFFLFATLEVSRPIAGGRINNTPVIPVLTGVPVAATNYLDRPAPAGYFIFPDLSVRHEGWYRLVFNLYEATKDPEDADVDRPFNTTELNTAPSTDPRAPLPHENMALRLEVRSTPFQVYSAKKFPGLSESTTLSRLVAEQGCRVRIRRDVRMRKRVEGRKDDPETLDDGHHSRHDTPDSYHPYTPNVDRPRSISRSSMDGSQYGSDHYRRASMENGYQGHVYQSATTPGSSGPVYSSGYPANILTTSPVGTSTPQYSSYPQTTLITSSTAPHPQFAVPQPRLSQDRAFEGIHHSSVQRFDQKQYWEQPKTKAMPRPITPEPYSSGAEVSNMLAPLRDLSRTPRQLNVNAGFSRWDIPEPTASKHRLSPPTPRAQMKPLKAGMRPETEQSVKQWNVDSMESDRDPYGHEYESVFEEPNSISMPYRRADGETVLKRIPNPEASPAVR